MKCFILVSLLSASTSVILEVLNINVVDLSTFVYKTHFSMYLLSTVGIGWTVVSLDKYDHVTLQELEALDNSFGLDIVSKFSPTLFLITVDCLFYISKILLIDVSVGGLISAVSFTLNYITVHLASSVNLVISRRLKVLLNQAELDTGELLLPFRTVFSLINRVQKSYSLQTFTGLSRVLTIALLSVIAYWKTLGLKQNCDCMEQRYPIMSLIFQLQLMFEMLFLSNSSTIILDLKQSLLHRLDQRISCEGGSNYRQRQMLNIVMLELKHTSVDFKVLDLFSMDNEAFTQIAGFLLSISMVYVQLSK